jgi:putative ABC transport system ATP-binding protein
MDFMTRTQPGELLIQARNLTKTYEQGQPALDHLTLDVRVGEALAVLGPSGSGKSTLLNMIAGLDKPTEGSITVGGLRIDELTEAASARYRRNGVGMVFQFFNLLDDLTVQDNILLPAQLAGVASSTAHERAEELLSYLGIDRFHDTFPGRLSGGQRQRVALARALMNRPQLILADEPTGALDSASTASVVRLLKDLNETGQTIVLVTHDMRLAEGCASRTIELVDGALGRDVNTVPR